MKKFKFPKRVAQVHVPLIAPYDLEDIARKEVRDVLSRYKSFPKAARFRFEYSYPSGICEVIIYKGRDL